MHLLDHVSITVRTLSGVKPFYIAVMSALGARAAYNRADAIGFGERNRSDDDVHNYAAFLLDPEGNKIEAVFHRGKAGGAP